jgi:hypothetical protein
MNGRFFSRLLMAVTNCAFHDTPPRSESASELVMEVRCLPMITRASVLLFHQYQNIEIGFLRSLSASPGAKKV